jgi:hypothetical protein
MTTFQQMAVDLRAHEALCRELLAVVEQENTGLRQAESNATFQFYRTRKNLLPRLDDSLQRLRRHRQTWQRLSLEERAQQSDIGSLLRLNQALTMKILVLDRENGQALLRKGLVPPAHLPPANRQRPNYVASLYARQSQS